MSEHLTVWRRNSHCMCFLMATRTATALHAARDRYARAHTCLKDAQYEHAMASKQLTIATEASVQAQKMQALNHNDTSCLFLSLLGTDLLQRCLAAPCGPRTCWGGRQGLTCKELGRLRLVATTFNAGLIEGTAELALSHLSNIEREWMSWRSRAVRGVHRGCAWANRHCRSRFGLFGIQLSADFAAGFGS